MLNRRTLLTRSALISLSPLAPAFLSRAFADQAAERDGRILVVVQLDGGNDGLNTVIPFADENYARFRPELRIPVAKVLKINDEVGLHPSLKPAAQLVEDGRMTIIQGVGYPNPNRSHFRSMAIWHTAQPDADDKGEYGWLGRAIDSHKSGPRAAADAVFVGDQPVPQALLGRRATAVSLNSQGDLQLAASVVPAALSPDERSEELGAYVERVVDRSFLTARQLAELSAPGSLHAGYPSSNLARQLSLASLLIKTGAGARVYYVSQPGYDTHAGQLATHPRLLEEFSSSVKAFLDDLVAARLADRVLLLAFSEFGRRVEENAGAGTDHGAAGPVFLAGPAAVGGVVGQHPSLADLDDGDLKMGLDFRGIYASLLDDWLRIPAKPVIADDFQCPALFPRNSALPTSGRHG
jgi:uncharacterized protein (DUF1501 family)